MTHIRAAFLATVAIVGVNSVARADMIGRYECTSTGAPVIDAIGDQPAHILSAGQFTCVGVDGLLKGATYTGFANSEWSGQNGTWITGGGVHRIPGGIAVQQLIDGTGLAAAPGQYDASGTGTIKFASGSLSGLAGKTLKWTSKSAGVGRSILEFTN
jgi:hypothetical protein